MHHTPDGVDDRSAAPLTIAGRTASAALAAVAPGPDDTVLIGGAGGGVGVFAVQLARIAGAQVIGTGAAETADHLRGLGAEPVVYGEGLADRARALAPGGITAAVDLYRDGDGARRPGSASRTAVSAPSPHRSTA
ncbi:hypothetical protein [Streptomyces pseudogriseolus]|uniref:hypothetical protein n=1 Tax=Streptomyces pseudogriseolus TaxID=36817 RepID=UPI001CE26D17|nr:hypothetical protein [Streptomyces pseudogriseolus]